MAATSALVDSFKATSINAVLWSQFTSGSATMSYTATGAIVNFPASSTASTDGDITSQTSYDLTGSYAFAEIITVPSAATLADASFTLMNGNNRLQWQYEAGTLYAQKIVAGVQTNIFSVAFNASTHAFWRIREASGITYWDTGSGTVGNVTWTNRFSVANPIAVTALSTNISGICFRAESNPGTFSWRNFNVLYTNINASTAMMMGV